MSCTPQGCPTQNCHWICRGKEIKMNQTVKCDKPSCIVSCQKAAPPIIKTECKPAECKIFCKKNAGGCNDCQTRCKKAECKQVFIAQKQECVTKCDKPICRIQHERPTSPPKPYCKLICGSKF